MMLRQVGRRLTSTSSASWALLNNLVDFNIDFNCSSCSCSYSGVRKAATRHFSTSYYSDYFSNAKKNVTTIKKEKTKSQTKIIDDSLTLSSMMLTAEEEQEILRIVNEINCSEDLLKYFIPKKKAEDLIKRKNDGNGNPNASTNANDLEQDEGQNQRISSLEELTSIIGPKNSPKFFYSVLEKPIPVSAKSGMFPLLSPEEIKKILRVLSLIIVGDRLSWNLIERNDTEVKDNEGSKNVSLAATSWEQVNYSFKPRMHFLVLLKEMENAVREIPECDLCLVEEYPATTPTPYMFTFHLHMAQVKSILLGILRARQNPPEIVSMKTVAVAKMFNTFVGSEKVSGQHVVNDLLINQKVTNFSMSDKILLDYNSSDVKVKEGLTQAFLMNLAYWKLTKQIEIKG